MWHGNGRPAQHLSVPSHAVVSVNESLSSSCAYYGRVAGTVNCLRLRPMTELGKTKRDGIPCVLTANGARDDTLPRVRVRQTSGKVPPRMKLEQFLRHHGITGNPFSEEDAQTDTVFKRLCLATIHHPAWNKFFGSPADPSTALVFGEKGSGKTALRLQAAAELEAYNQANPGERVLAISYDDFNPYLDSCRSAMRAANMDAVLESWKLQDHMDAILSLGVTKLVDLLTSEKVALTVLTLDQRRDLLLLAALYDASRASRSPAAGAGCAGGRASARSGPAATCRSASARAWW